MVDGFLRPVRVAQRTAQVDVGRDGLGVESQGFLEGADGLVKRYPKAQARDFDGQPDRITEMDALIAYLQMLGTLVDFNAYKADANLR